MVVMFGLLMLAAFGITILYIVKLCLAFVKNRPKKPIVKRIGIALLVVAISIFGVARNQQPPEKISNPASREQQTVTSSTQPQKVSETQVTKTEQPTTSKDKETATVATKSDITHQSKNIKGRGWGDKGYPRYENLIGYVVVNYDGYELQKNGQFLNTPWLIPTYTQDKQFWDKTEQSLEHKTKIVVKKQMLEHAHHDIYKGHLLVERIDDGAQFYIDVNNFVVNPYWQSNDLESAAKEGRFIATYHQRSNYYPTNKNGDKVDLQDGDVAFVTGVTGLYGRGGPDMQTNQIQATVYKEWPSGYHGIEVFFNKDDLTVQY